MHSRNNKTVMTVIRKITINSVAKGSKGLSRGHFGLIYFSTISILSFGKRDIFLHALQYRTNTKRPRDNQDPKSASKFREMPNNHGKSE